MGPAQEGASAAPGGALADAPAQAADVTPAPDAAEAPPADAATSPPEQAAAATAQEGASVAPGIPLEIQMAAMGAAAAAPSAATAAVAIPPGRSETLLDAKGDGLLTDEYLDKHFHQEAVWVAQRAHLDIGADSGPSGWTSSGTPIQMRNRLTADKIVLFCARKSSSGENGNRPLLWDWRSCESEEASAYNRLVAGNEFPAAGRGIVLGCAGADSYIYLERCVETMAEAAKP